MTFLIHFETFRVRTSSRLAAMRKMSPEKVSKNQPKDPNVRAEQTKTAGGKSHSARRTKPLTAVPNVVSSVKRKIASNIGRKTKRAMSMTEIR